jgi:PTS system mannitol-specific IIC component
MVHGTRGGVVGAIATAGVIVGAEGTPMFLGAMIIAPLSAWLLKKFDELVEGRVASGFEMLIDNFSSGILGAAMAVGGFYSIGPVIRSLMDWAEQGVGFLVDSRLLPLASIVVEPGKVLFLNNAINHGVFTPLGAAQSKADGQSILFMIETNPGPGLGILVAFMLFGPIALRASAPAAMVIHFLGGIHEIYFPYILMKPRLILAAILGGGMGVLTNVILGNGLVASPAPGSIFAYMAMTPRGDHLLVLASILVAAVVSFFVAAVLMGFGRGEKADDAAGNLTDAELSAHSKESA